MNSRWVPTGFIHELRNGKMVSSGYSNIFECTTVEISRVILNLGANLRRDEQFGHTSGVSFSSKSK